MTLITEQLNRFVIDEKLHRQLHWPSICLEKMKLEEYIDINQWMQISDHANPQFDAWPLGDKNIPQIIYSIKSLEKYQQNWRRNISKIEGEEEEIENPIECIFIIAKYYYEKYDHAVEWYWRLKEFALLTVSTT